MNAALLASLLNTVNAAFRWLTQRGFTRDRIQQMLDAAHETGADISTATAQAELDALDAELDETENLINENDTG